MASTLENKIIRQIEYYFGDINLPRDKFMQEKLKEDDEGWITLNVLLTFKRLAALSQDQDVIVEAMKKADSGLVEISTDGKKLRRNVDLPLPEFNDDRKKELMERTAYAKGFKSSDELNDIMTFLEPYGPIDSCSRRLTKEQIFKGSCFIIFKTVGNCKKFIEQESVKYNDVELIRKWQERYFDEQREQYEERVKCRLEKKQVKLGVPKKKFGLAKGAIIHFSGIAEGKTLTREEIKEKITENDQAEVSYIDFNKGDLEGYIRLASENAAVDLLKKIGEELEVGDQKLKIRVLEGEEEEQRLQKIADSVSEMRHKLKFGKKRRGNFNSGRDAKSKKGN